MARRWVRDSGISKEKKLCTVCAAVALAAFVTLTCTPRAAAQDDDEAPVPAQTAAGNPPEWSAGHTIVNPAVKFDTSAPLTTLLTLYQAPPRVERPRPPNGTPPGGAGTIPP